MLAPTVIRKLGNFLTTKSRTALEGGQQSQEKKQRTVDCVHQDIRTINSIRLINFKNLLSNTGVVNSINENCNECQGIC